MLKEGCVWVTCTLSTRVFISIKEVARGQDGVKIKGMIDLVKVKRDMLYYEQEVRAGRERGQGLSYHHVVLWKVRLVEVWIKGIKENFFLFLSFSFAVLLLSFIS